MKRPGPKDLKSYCHRDDCDIVDTGINLLTFKVCRSCKFECSESLEERVKNKNSKSKEESDIEDIYNGWVI